MQTTTHPARSFQLQLGSGGVARTVLAPLERLLALTELGRLYGTMQGTRSPSEFLERALDGLGIRRPLVRGAQHLPSSGPAIVATNHPFGAVEGLLLARELRALRPDVRILANRFLERIPELSELFLFVDVFGGQGSVQRNASALRQARRWLERGGMLAIFPAGEVSSLSLSQRGITDSRWSPSLVSLAQRTGACICPGFFEGRNSALFQIAGLLHPRLRTALLPREFVNKRGADLRLSFGAPITAAELAPLCDDQARTDWCRLRAYALQRDARKRRLRPRRALAPIVSSVPAHEIQAEIAALPREARLAELGELEAWIAPAASIPNTLGEIGRLREISFRAAGEGSGRGRDLDRFDAHYQHLFLWDRAGRRLAGGYRLGLVDELLARGGSSALYTSSLFEYGPEALRALGSGLELGRSFVAPDYQRAYAPLLTLWRGIGAFVARNPRYRTLFGPVSISADYHPLSRQLLGHWLEVEHPHATLFGKVRGRTPPEFGTLHGLSPRQLRELATGRADVSRLVPQIERNRRGVPVLLAEYLKLGGKLLALNVDANFQDALDALLVVDLVAAPRKLIERYFGAQATAAFLAAQARDARVA